MVESRAIARVIIKKIDGGIHIHDFSYNGENISLLSHFLCVQKENSPSKVSTTLKDLIRNYEKFYVIFCYLAEGSRRLTEAGKPEI